MNTSITHTTAFWFGFQIFCKSWTRFLEKHYQKHIEQTGAGALEWLPIQQRNTPFLNLHFNVQKQFSGIKPSAIPWGELGIEMEDETNSGGGSDTEI